MAGLYMMNTLFPNDGIHVNPPNLPDVIRDLANEVADLPPDEALPQWLVERGVGALVTQYIEGSLPHFARATARLEAAGQINKLDQIAQHPTCDRARLPCQLPEPAVWTPVWHEDERQALLVTVALNFSGDLDETATETASAEADVGGVAWRSVPLVTGLRGEARAAMTAAANLMAEAGLPATAVPAVEPATQRVVPSIELETLYAAPAVALSYLAGRFGLQSPAELGVVVLGRATPGGGWSAVDPRLVEALKEGTAVDVIIVRTDTGWEKESAESRSVEHNPDPTLAGAASLVWGSEWSTTVEEARSKMLADAGWSWKKAAKDEKQKLAVAELPLVESELALGLYRRLALVPTDKKLSAVILGGPAATGKSVAASQVIQRLLGGGWTVLMLTAENHELLSVDDMTALVRSALLLSGNPVSLKTLVVLEDLYPVGATNIGDVVAGVNIELHVNVLAVARYETTSGKEWESGAMDLTASIVGPAALLALAERLSKEHPTVYGRNRSDLGPLVRAAGGDLRLLSQLMVSTADDLRGSSDLDRVELRQRVAGELLEGDPDLADTIRLLAATSLVGTWLNCGHLSEAVVRRLLNRGAQQRREGLTLSSPFLGRLVLAQGGKDDVHSLRPTLVALLGPYLSSMLTSGEDLTVARLVRSCRAYDPELLAALLGVAGIDRDVRYWLERAAVRPAAAVLRSLDFGPNSEQVADLVTHLLARVHHRVDLSAGELGSILRLIHKYRSNFEPGPGTGDVDVYTVFLDRLSEPAVGLQAILNREATLSQRVEVANQLSRFSRQDLEALVVSNAAGFLHGVRAAAEHYRLLRKLDQTLERCRPEGAAPNGQRSLSTFDQLHELLEHRPPAGESFDTVASWLAFQVYFGTRVDREELLTKNRDAFLTALSTAGAAEVARGLDELFVKREVFGWMINVLLNDSPFIAHLTNVLRNAQPAEAAALVSAVGRLHGSAMRDVIYDLQDGQLIPREDIARKLAKRVGDAKGIGMLLNSVHQVDEWFMPGGDGFANRIAENLGRDAARRLVQTDPRSSVLYYFFRALWQSRASFWAEVEREAFDTIVGSLRSARSFTRPWAPHLALLIGADDHLGEAFLRDLSGQVDEQAFLRQMTAPARADALTHLHRLGRALHPRIAEQFISSYEPKDQLKPLLTVPPQALVDYLRVTAETMMMGGRLDANRYLAQEVASLQPGFSWEKTFRDGLYRAGDIAQGINSLARLDHVRAVEMVHRLDEDEDNGGPSYLKKAMLKAARRPAELTELLTACHRLSPELGQRLFREVRETGWAWRLFSTNLQWEQLAVEQCRVGMHLAALGFTPSGDNAAWMRSKLLDERWMKVAPMITSPLVASSLLKLLYVWRPTWAMEFSRSLDVDRLLRRLRKLGAFDARYLPALINLFALVRDEASVARLLDLVGEADQRLLVARVGLRSGAKLLYQLAGKAPGLVDGFASAFADEFDATLRRRIVLNQAEYWRELGWAAAALHRGDRANLISDADPAVAPNAAFAAEVAWAATWMRRPDLLDDFLDRSIDRITSQSGTGDHANRIGMVMIAAARENKVGSILNDEANASQIATAGLGLLTLAFETAPEHQGLADLLKKLRPTIQKRLQEPSVAADPFRAQLTSLLGRQ
jgi:hypothetical protein